MGGVRTVFGWGRRVQRLRYRSGPGAGTAVAALTPLAAARSPLVVDEPGPQIHAGVRLVQVDGTTCGSAVLVALAAWADPGETRRLDGAQGPGFGDRYGARQRQVHRESTPLWPQALGTSPWGMVGWLRRNAPAAGRYRVRMVDDTDAADVAAVLDEVGAALAVGRPVALLVGSVVPRHYCLALRAAPDAWHVYEPSSGEVRAVPTALVGRRGLTPLLGFGRLHAALLPV
jgi:hypothetical protein